MREDFIISDAFLPETTWRLFKVSCENLTCTFDAENKTLFVNQSSWVIYINMETE